MKGLFRSGTFWFAVLAVILLAVGLLATLVFWEWLHPKAPTTVSNSETLRNAGLLIGGTLALVFALWRGWVAELQTSTAQRQAETAQRGLLQERYHNGAEMLGSEVVFVRLGALHDLERLAREHPEEYHVQIMQLLSDFARHATGEDGRDEIQAAMAAIGARGETGRGLEKATENFRLAIHGARLGNTHLPGVNLAGANFGGADMRGAYLLAADLSGAHLQSANLHKANFIDANLSQATLSGTDMSYVVAQGTNFSNAQLGSSNLSYSHLQRANLSGASLNAADLSHARLENANLSGARIGAATRTTLSDPPVSEELFVRMTQSQLDEACADADNPPIIAPGTVDIETGKPLIWRGKPCGHKQSF